MNYRKGEGDGDEDTENEHSRQSRQVQAPPTDPVHQWNGYQRHHNHNGANSARCVRSQIIGNSSAGEQFEWIIEYLKKTRSVMSRILFSKVFTNCDAWYIRLQK